MGGRKRNNENLNGMQNADRLLYIKKYVIHAQLTLLGKVYPNNCFSKVAFYLKSIDSIYYRVVPLIHIVLFVSVNPGL